MEVELNGIQILQPESVQITKDLGQRETNLKNKCTEHRSKYKQGQLN